MTDYASIGTAISLGNLAHPDTAKVFTGAVANKQKLDLLAATKVAKDAVAAKKLEQEMIQQMKTTYGKYLPYYDEKAKGVAGQGWAQMKQAYDKGDQTALQSAHDKMQQQLNALQNESDQAEQWLKGEQAGNLVPGEFKTLLNDRSPDAGSKFQIALEKNPILKSFGGFTPTGALNFNDVKNNDLPTTHDKTMNENSKYMEVLSNPKTGQPLRGVKTLGNNTYQFTKELTPAHINALAAGLADDPGYAINTRYKNTKLYQEGLAEAEKEMKVVGGQWDDAMKQKYAVAYAAKQELLAKNNLPYTAGIWHQPAATEEKNKKVEFTAEQITDQDAAANIILGFGPKTRVHHAAPDKGENKTLNLSAPSGFIIDNGVKKFVDLKGKPLVGKVVETISGAPDKDGNKPVYAVVHAKGLTYEEMGKYLVSGKGQVEKLNERPEITYYIPWRDIAKNVHNEYKTYGRTNTIQELDRLHGTNYRDQIPVEAPAKRATPAPKQGRHRGVYNPATGKIE